MISLFFISCDGWLGRTKPSDFLTNSEVWNDDGMVESTLANMYDNVPNNGSLENDANFSLFDDFMWCGLMNTDVETARNQMVSYSYDIFRYYDYSYIYRLIQACLFYPSPSPRH